MGQLASEFGSGYAENSCDFLDICSTSIRHVFWDSDNLALLKFAMLDPIQAVLENHTRRSAGEKVH